jgi:hypothetical protein
MPNFCFRLLFRLGIVIDSDEQAIDISTTLCAHPLQLMARAPTIRTSRKLAIRSCGYGSEDEARQSGTRVLNAMLLGGLIQRSGVDFGTGRRGPQFSQAIKNDIAKTGATLRDEVEGLDVYEGLDTSFFSFQGEATVSGHGPAAVSELIERAADYSRALTERQRIAAELLNDSLFGIPADASFLLRISAIEALCPQGSASDAYISLAKTLRNAIPADVPEDDKRAMERLLERDTTRQSVRSAYISKFRRLLGGQKAKEFEELYNLRSKFLHEGLGRGSFQEPADAAFNLAQELLLADISSGQIA